MRRVPRVLTLLLVVALAWDPAPARAASLNQLRKEVADLEQQTRNLGIGYKAKERSLSQMAESRLVDAQVLYSLKDYTRAAILFLDYVNKYKNTRGYPEALFYLADCLYHKRDFLSAKRYFQMIVDQGATNRYYQEALQRLVELSMRMGDSSYIEQYLGRLASIPTNQMKPSVPYVRAKYFYFKGDIDQAINYFRQIPPGHPYHLHAQYFIGAALVRKKDFAGATKVFQHILTLYPKSDNQKHIRDLAYLGLGRLFYEKGKAKQAIEMYQKVPRTSPEFDAALYEIAWAYIKIGEHRKALRALELLALANPDSPFVPEVKVLQGNLLIRLKQWGLATKLFSGARDKFVPVYNRMQQVMQEHSDPNLFFDLLLTRDTTSFAIKIQVPRLAINWVKEKGHVKRALNLVQDVRDIEASIKESNTLIKKLERAINSPAKIKIFPEFAAAKAKSLEVENRLIMARLEILAKERDLVISQASGDQRSKLHSLAARRTKLEEAVRKLPKSEAGYRERQREQLEKLEEMEKELNRMSILVINLGAQLVATEKYFQDTQAKRAKGVREGFAREAADVRRMVESLQEEVDDLNQSVIDAKAQAGVGGPEEVAERTVKADYRKIINQEHELLASLRGGLSGQKARDFDDLARLMGRCEQVDAFIAGFDKKLDTKVEEKLSTIRETINDEKTKMVRYQVELTDYQTRTNKVAGYLTYEGFRAVAKRFYEIVVRADVGIIDVAWALKDAKSKEVSRLVRQRAMDLKLLDDEFKEVLRED